MRATQINWNIFFLCYISLSCYGLIILRQQHQQTPLYRIIIIQCS
jgi:hypothetical protein